jgi:hypothetical protein
MLLTCMVTDEDDPDDSDYNSVDAERDIQEDNDNEGTPKPKPKVQATPSHESSRFFRGYIEMRWVINLQENFHRDLKQNKQKYTCKE